MPSMLVPAHVVKIAAFAKVECIGQKLAGGHPLLFLSLQPVPDIARPIVSHEE